MKRTLITIGLLLSASTALAEWSTLDEDRDSYTYIETDRLRFKGDTVKYWLLHSYKSPKKNDDYYYQSTVTLSELNCSNETIQILAMSQYDGKMGKGKVVYSAPDKSAVKNIVPGTFADALLDGFCKSKKR